MKSFDPYDQLMELIKFANMADVHIKNLIKNEKELITAINNQAEKIDKLENKLKLLDKILQEMVYETTNKK